MASILGDSRDRLKELSMVFQGSYEGWPYTRKAFSESLGAIFSPLGDYLFAMGPLNRNHEWYVTMKTQEVKDQLLAREKAFRSPCSLGTGIRDE